MVLALATDLPAVYQQHADQSTATYRRDIDGLRALAVLLVIGYHAAPIHVPGGFIGVDVFFVISGYLISGIILRETRLDTFSFTTFYARRCRRILPALIVVLVAVWAIGWWTLMAAEFDELGEGIAAGATFTTNFWLRRNYGYFATPAALNPLLHLWSLAVEEQFYLLWPVLLYVGVKRRLPLVPLVSTLAVLSFALNIEGLTNHAFGTFYLLPTRFWELLTGAWLACWEARQSATGAARWPWLARQPAPVRSTVQNVAAILAFSAILVAALLVTERLPYPGWWALVPTLSTLVLLSVGHSVWVGRVALSGRIAVALGLVSYPLYLWHWPLLSIARIVEEGPPTRLIRAGLACSALPLAWLTWRLVERPVRHWLPADAPDRNARRFIAVGVSCLAAIGGVGWATHYWNGVPARHEKIEQRRSALSLSEFLRHWTPYAKCSGPLRSGYQLNFCATSRADLPAAAILGDSHAMHLFPGIADTSAASWLILAENSCPPLSDVRVTWLGKQEVCSEMNRVAVELVVHRHEIKTVVLSSRGPEYYDNPKLLLSPARPGGEAAVLPRALFAYGLSQQISTLEAAGRDVVLFMDIPDLGFHPAACTERPFTLTKRVVVSPCVANKAVVVQWQADYRRMVGDLARAHPRLRVFDPIDLFCDDRWCHAERNDELLYRDRHHLSLRGSQYVAEHFLRWLNRDGL